MSSQRRFEGTDLEALLDEVRGTLGDDAHIVAANRVRKGGVGGFFAREYFEVIAEEPEVAIDLRPAVRLGRRRRDTANAPAAGSRSVPRSVLDLVEERNNEERAMAYPDIDVTDEPVVRIAEYADDTDDSFFGDEPTWSHRDDIAAEREGVPLSSVYDELRKLAPEPEPVVEPEPQAELEPLIDAPRVSTESDRFAQILERLAHSTEHRAGSSDAPSAIVDTAIPVTAPQPAPAPRAPKTVAPPTIVPPASVPPTVVSLVDAERAATSYTARGVATSAPSAPPAPSPTSGAEETIERPEHMLVRLGLPARFVPRGMSGDALREALVESLDRLPRVAELPKTKGVVVAIVGLGARPVLLARSVSEELGLDPDEVVVATETEIDGVPAWLQITEPEAADERRRSWRRREQLTFVAISQPALTTSAGWVSDMLDKLEPTQLWAVAAAGWKPEDVDAWSRRLGGFDLLALDRLVDTVSPASMLSLGLPVGRLDGDEATPERWADALLDRIGAKEPARS